MFSPKHKRHVDELGQHKYRDNLTLRVPFPPAMNDIDIDLNILLVIKLGITCVLACKPEYILQYRRRYNSAQSSLAVTLTSTIWTRR